jgi:hypothetical protein
MLAVMRSEFCMLPPLLHHKIERPHGFGRAPE